MQAPIDRDDLTVMFLIFGIVLLVILAVDIAIFVRWLIYSTKVSGAGRADAPAYVPQADLSDVEPVDIIVDSESLPGSVAEPATQYSFYGTGAAREPARLPFAPTWSLVHPFIAIQLVLAAVTAVQLFALIPAYIQYGHNAISTPYGTVVIIATLFLQNILFVGVTGYLVSRYGTSLSKIGLRAPRRNEVIQGIVFGLALCIVAGMLEQWFNAAAGHLVGKQFLARMTKLSDELSAGGQFEQIHGVFLQIGFILAGAVAAPIGEEIFFRGLLYNGLRRRWGVSVAVIVSALCFALIHVAPVNVLIIIPMGVILALVYEHTKSLWVTILMHAMNNGIQLAIAMYTLNHAKPGH